MQCNKKEKGVISLIVLLGIGFLALGMAFAISTSTLSELSKNRNTFLGDKAFYTADAAARKGAYNYIANSSYTGGSFELLNGDSASNIIITDPCPSEPYVCVEGQAGNLIANRKAIYKLTKFPEGLSFNYAIFSQNNLNFGGSATVNGNIFANGNIDFHGAHASVNGDAFSPGTIDDFPNIGGETVEGVDSIPKLEIDPQPYRDEAEAAGTLFTPSDAESYLNNQAKTAVIYVEGNTHMGGNNTNLIGALVVEGSLKVSGGTYTAKEDYPAIIVQGDLEIAGGAIINGVIYVTGSTSFGAGGGTINGAIISVGEISQADFTGNATINYNPDLIGNWLEFPGIDPGSSTSPPVIINWWEE